MTKERFMIFCTGVAMVNNLLAIYSTITSKSSLSVAILLICILLSCMLAVITYQYINTRNHRKINENFIDFIGYLFDNPEHRFNLLPKVCLMLYRTDDYNKLNIKVFDVSFEYDFEKINRHGLCPNSIIEYKDTMEYSMSVKNESIPEEYILYHGNTSAKKSSNYRPSAKISQKHGCMTNYIGVPKPEEKENTSFATRRYSWKIEKENITQADSFPLAFKIVYDETAKADASDTLVFYPIQYAKSIEQLRFHVKFNHSDAILVSANCYQIKNTSKGFRQVPIECYSAEDINKNVVSFSVKPECSLCEVFYITVKWKLSEDTPN